MTSPPVVIWLASTDGTNNTLMGWSAVPMSDVAGASVAASVGASVAISVGASVATSVGSSVVGGSVGAAVTGAQAETTSTSIAITARNRYSDFFIFFSSCKGLGLGKSSLSNLIIQCIME